MELLAVLHAVSVIAKKYSILVDGARCESHTLSATIGPLVARVSAAITTPPLNRHPTIVVPVLVALGSGTPWA